MTQFATLQLVDSVATTRNLLVQGINYSTGVATWRQSGDTFDKAAIAATFSLTPPTSKSTRTRVRFKLVSNVYDAVDTSKKIDEIIFNGEFVLPNKSSLLGRQNNRAMVKSFLENAVIISAVENFESVY